MGHRARWPDQATGDQRPIRNLSQRIKTAELPKALTPHSFRHSYVSHLTENGVDRRFIQVQVGHECDSSTAIYTHVSDDFMNTMLQKALSPAFGPAAQPDKER
ncbi:MAG: tyrosine-type recombinase/integrase [Pseudonocardiaceae bacterium]